MEDRLQKFARIVEIGSITGAAKDLRISQPALSTAMHKLERELKTELIQHTGRTIAITEAGKMVYHTASSIRTNVRNLQQELSRLRQQKPHIRIGMIDSLAELLCIKGDLLQQLEAIATTSLVVNNSADLLQAVEQGRLDVALAAWQPHTAAMIEMTTIGSEPLTLVTQSEGVAGVRAQVKRGILPNFLAYNPASNTFQLIRRHLAERNLQANTTFHSTSPEVILQLVLAGRGVAALPFQMVYEQLQAGKLSPISTHIIKRPIIAVQHKERTKSPGIDICVDYARKALSQVTTTAKTWR